MIPEGLTYILLSVLFYASWIACQPGLTKHEAILAQPGELHSLIVFTFRARADGCVVLDVAVCAAAADLGGPEAGVLAVEVDARLLVVAVVVLGALGVAPALGHEQ